MLKITMADDGYHALPLVVYSNSDASDRTNNSNNHEMYGR
jgi:hypothetical protein